MDDRVRLIGEAIAAYERDGQAALESACAAHPDLADEIRRAASALDVLRGAAGERPPAMTELAATITVGSVVGHFRIEGLLGRGGMGTVFRARDLELDREVALKVVSIPLLSHDEALSRIRREARLLAQARHDNIVRVYEVGQTPDGQPFFVMDLIEGAPLSVLLARLSGRNPADLKGADLLSGLLEDTRATTSYEEAVVRLLLPIADALEAAHRVGVIHRDVKPSNILVDRQGRPHLMDFGIAREVDTVSLSNTGHGAGTPLYMAPEQIAGSDRGDMTAVTDVYSLGVTLYQALTLRVPFEGDSPAKIYWQILNAEALPPRTRNPSISIDLDTICRAAMEKQPRDRYRSAADLAYDLRYFLDLRPIRRRPLGRLGRLQRLVRRNPWPATTTFAASVALVVLSYAAIAARKDARVNDLKEDAYTMVGKPDADLVEFDKVVRELSVLVPQDPEVRDFRESLNEMQLIASSGDAVRRAYEALAAARLLLKRGSADDAGVERLYAQCLDDINQSVILRPDRGLSWALVFTDAYAFRKEWI